MPVDLLLTIGHHLSVFTLVGLIAAEFALLRPGLLGGRIAQLAHIDAAYGAVAALVIVIGVLRVIYGDGGWAYYAGNHAFWGKMVAFLLVGLLSVPPTFAIRKWARAVKTAPDYAAPAAELARSRRFLHLEIAILALVPVFAAVMARG